MALLIVIMSVNVYAVTYTSNLIPTMTSNTAPSGTASASSEYQGTYLAYKAFDNSSTTRWLSNYTVNPWLSYEFPTTKKIVKYTITPETANGVISSWQFQGWNESTSSWDVLHIGTTNLSPAGTKKEFTFTNNNYYKKYRIYVIHSTAVYADFRSVEMMEEGIVAKPSNLNAVRSGAQINLSWDTVTGAVAYNIKRSTNIGGPYTTLQSNYISNTYNDTTELTNYTTYYYVVSAIGYSGEGLNSDEASAYYDTRIYSDDLIPEMTSNTAPSGIASASTEYQGTYLAYKAFDNNTTTRWVSNLTMNPWISYEFATPKKIAKYTIVPQTLNGVITSWQFQGWNETTNIWEVLHTGTTSLSPANVKKEFSFSNNNYYKKYRIFVTNSSAIYADFYNVEMMETTDIAPVSSIYVTENPFSVEKGTTRQMVVKAIRTDGTETDITSLASYSIIDDTIASVSNDGIVTGNFPGNTSINITYENKSTVVNVTVPDPDALFWTNTEEFNEVNSDEWPTYTNNGGAARFADALGQTAFFGTNDNIGEVYGISNHTLRISPTTDFVAEARVAITGEEMNYHLIDDNNLGLWVIIKQNGLWLHSPDGNHQQISTTTAFSDGKWHTIKLRKNGLHFGEVYLDDHLIATNITLQDTRGMYLSGVLGFYSDRLGSGYVDRVKWSTIGNY